MIAADVPVTGKVDLKEAAPKGRAAPGSSGEVIRRGVEIVNGYSGVPDEHGILKRYEIALPEFTRGCYYAQDKPNAWPAGANRALPYACGSDFEGLNYGGLFAVLELTAGGYLAMVPIAGPLTMTWFEPTAGGGLVLDLGTLGTASVECDAPLVAWSRSGDVYTACREAWAEALTSAPVEGRTDLRFRKTYPEVFRYLGWCSWEEYRKRIDSELLVGAARDIEGSGLPIRYMLVDDGHQTADGNRLKSFAPDKRKFPDGWKPLLGMRRGGGIRWMGLWHAFQGLWDSISEENDFGDALNSHLTRLPGGKYLPRDDPDSARAFYDALIGSAKEHGFDFVKIDNQAGGLQCYRGSPNAVRAAATSAQAMEAAAARELRGLINCMAHNSVCIFGTRHSAVTRCSIDYGVGDARKGKSHIWQSYANTLWLGQTVWGDHDMFHSSDPACGRLMAVSKAMSGAPVYLSDNPKEFVAGYVRPLCYEDGELLRPLAPAAPLPDSVFVDPMKEQVAYRVVAPLPGGAAAVVAYNLGDPTPDAPIKAALGADDYAHAGGMIQPREGRWKVPAEGLVFYDWYAGTGGKLEGEYAFELEGFADRLVHLCPVREGWAVVGRTDKYLSPAAVEVLSASRGELELRMVESGPFAVWSGRGAPRAEGIAFARAGGGLYKADLPVGGRGRTVTIGR